MLKKVALLVCILLSISMSGFLPWEPQAEAIRKPRTGNSESRPPHRPSSRRLQLGMYTLFNQPGLNARAIAKQIYESDFTDVSFHALSPWNSTGRQVRLKGQKTYTGFFPWRFNEKKMQYDLRSGNINREWFNHLREFLEWMAFYRIGVQIKFFDQYMDDSWYSSHHMIPKFHPFRDNNLNATFDSNHLYNGAWLRLHPNSESTDGYRLTPFGEALHDYLDEAVKVFREVKSKYPDFRIQYALFNEMVQWVDKNGEVVERKTLGGKTQIETWMREQIWQKNGFSYGTDYIECVDWTSLKGFDANLPHRWIIDFRSLLHRNRFITVERDAIHEVHGVESTDTVEHLKRNGLEISDRLLLSTDATKEDATYLDRMRGLVASDLPYLEIKFSLTDRLNNKFYDAHDVNASFRKMFPVLRKEVDRNPRRPRR